MVSFSPREGIFCFATKHLDMVDEALERSFSPREGIFCFATGTTAEVAQKRIEFQSP